jgi:hypothetical protein
VVPRGHGRLSCVAGISDSLAASAEGLPQIAKPFNDNLRSCQAQAQDEWTYRNGNQVFGNATEDAKESGIREAAVMLGKAPAVGHGATQQYRIDGRQGASASPAADERSAAAAGCASGQSEEPAASSWVIAAGAFLRGMQGVDGEARGQTLADRSLDDRCAAGQASAEPMHEAHQRIALQAFNDGLVGKRDEAADPAPIRDHRRIRPLDS